MDCSGHCERKLQAAVAGLATMIAKVAPEIGRKWSGLQKPNGPNRDSPKSGRSCLGRGRRCSKLPQGLPTLSRNWLKLRYDMRTSCPDGRDRREFRSRPNWSKLPQIGPSPPSVLDIGQYSPRVLEGGRSCHKVEGWTHHRVKACGCICGNRDTVGCLGCSGS